MVNHTVHSYDNDLNLLINSLGEMTNLVHQELKIADQAWQSPDVSLVTEARELDKKVNTIDTIVEQRATSLLALRQPMGIDLRFIVSTLKLIVVIERIGDLAKNTAKRACNFAKRIDPELLVDFRKLMDKIFQMSEMIQETLKMQPKSNSYQTMCDNDDEVDMMTNLLIQKISSKMINCYDNNSIELYINFIFAVKNMERAGDCITKISRICHYIVSGQKLGKHQYRSHLEEN